MVSSYCANKKSDVGKEECFRYRAFCRSKVSFENPWNCVNLHFVRLDLCFLRLWAQLAFCVPSPGTEILINKVPLDSWILTHILSLIAGLSIKDRNKIDQEFCSMTFTGNCWVSESNQHSLTDRWSSLS